VTQGQLPLPLRSLLPLAAALAVSLALAGCSSVRDMTNSIGLSDSTDLPRNEAALNRFAEDWGQRYDRNPKDKKAAMTYASALRALGQHAQAAAVLQGLAARNPQDREILGAYGKSLADAGRLKEASSLPMRIRQSGRTARSSRRRAPSPISSAITIRRRTITKRRFACGRTSRASCRISACPMR